MLNKDLQVISCPQVHARRAVSATVMFKELAENSVQFSALQWQCKHFGHGQFVFGKHVFVRIETFPRKM